MRYSRQAGRYRGLDCGLFPSLFVEQESESAISDPVLSGERKAQSIPRNRRNHHEAFEAHLSLSLSRSHLPTSERLGNTLFGSAVLFGYES